MHTRSNLTEKIVFSCTEIASPSVEGLAMVSKRAGQVKLSALATVHTDENRYPELREYHSNYWILAYLLRKVPTTAVFGHLLEWI